MCAARQSERARARQLDAGEHVDDPAGGVRRPIPPGWQVGRERTAGQQLWDLEDPLGIEPEQRVRADRACDRSLGVCTQREARDSEERRLLLNAAGIGEDAGRVLDQAEELEVSDRVESVAAVRGPPPQEAVFSAARVRGCTGNTTGSCSATCASACIASNSSGPSTSAGRWSVTTRYSPRRRPSAAAAPSASIRSDIATSVSIIVLPTRWILSARDSLSTEVVDRLRRVDEQQVRHRVGDHPVDLLGHRPVKAAQAGLDVADRDAELACDQAGRQRGVDIAWNEHDVRLGLEQHGLQPLHHASGLLRVRARADAEHVVWGTDAQFLEEHLGHRGVVVLAGVDQHRARTRRDVVGARR